MAENNSETVFIINYPPEFCPGCGHKFKNWDHLARQDFFAHAAHQCPECGTKFMYFSGQLMKVVSMEVGGDL